MQGGGRSSDDSEPGRRERHMHSSARAMQGTAQSRVKPDQPPIGLNPAADYVGGIFHNIKSVTKTSLPLQLMLCESM